MSGSFFEFRMIQISATTSQISAIGKSTIQAE